MRNRTLLRQMARAPRGCPVSTPLSPRMSPAVRIATSMFGCFEGKLDLNPDADVDVDGLELGACLDDDDDEENEEAAAVFLANDSTRMAEGDGTLRASESSRRLDDEDLVMVKDDDELDEDEDDDDDDDDEEIVLSACACTAAAENETFELCDRGEEAPSDFFSLFVFLLESSSPVESGDDDDAEPDLVASSSNTKSAPSWLTSRLELRTDRITSMVN